VLWLRHAERFGIATSRIMAAAQSGDSTSHQAGNNVANHSKIQGGRRLNCADATERPCNEVDQNLFHVGLPVIRYDLFLFAGSESQAKTMVNKQTA
jgi:hypothetical protein